MTDRYSPAFILAAAIASLLPASGLAQPYKHVADTPHLTPEQEKATFRLPPGFEAQLVAAEPDIQKPMNMAFDAKGQLWLTDTVEYPYPVGDGEKGRDRVVILSDFGPDGRAGKVQVFADGLNIPIGILPLPSGDECIVFSIPNLWHLQDTDGDGKADQRKILYGTFGRRDTHGLINAIRLGFDGWVYLNHGYSNTSEVKAEDGSSVTMQSGNTFRVARDGSHVEQFTHGQVNPFGSCFDEWGNLYTADCHSKPITQLLRGAYYDSFGKPHDGLGYGPDMIRHSHDSTALCGLVHYTAEHFPEAYWNMMFLGNVTGNRINCDKITLRGSSPVAEHQPDFLISDDPWFRPVDLQIGPDGAMYVADFYNRIIGHYEVPLDHPGRDRTSGRIWRIVHTGNKLAPVMDLTRATPEELLAKLADPNLGVRLAATHQLAERGPRLTSKMYQAFRDSKDPHTMVHAMWALERTGSVSDSDLSAVLLHGPDLGRVHALRIIAERGAISPLFRKHAVELVNSGRHPLVRRCAAEVLGRHPDKADYPHLLRLVAECPEDDTHLKHVARMALRDLLNAVPDALPSEPGEDEKRIVAGVALAIQRPEAAAFLARHIDDGRAEAAARHVGQHGKPGHIDTVLNWIDGRPLGVQLAAYRGLKQGAEQRGAKLPDRAVSQAAETAKAALGGDQVRDGVELARELRLTSLRDPITELARSREKPADVRGPAFNALVAIDAGHAVGVVSPVVADGTEPFEVREQAARVLTALNRDDARAAAVEALKAAPARLANVIASGLCDTPAGARAVIAAIDKGEASPRLLQDRGIVTKLGQRGIPDIDQTIARLTAGIPSADAKILELIRTRTAAYAEASRERERPEFPERERPDPELGAEVFKKHCAACHRIGPEGPMIGPQLDGIGNRGLARLLEDTLDPSRNVDKALRSTRLDLADGRVLTGLVLREVGEAIVIADDKGKEIQVPRADVLEQTTSPTSPMPANFQEVIEEKDFHHLMAYLLEQRQKTEE